MASSGYDRTHFLQHGRCVGLTEQICSEREGPMQNPKNEGVGSALRCNLIFEQICSSMTFGPLCGATAGSEVANTAQQIGGV